MADCKVDENVRASSSETTQIQAGGAERRVAEVVQKCKPNDVARRTAHCFDDAASANDMPRMQVERPEEADQQARDSGE